MREIKFRAWDKLTNEMIGDGFHLFGEFMMFRLIEIYCIEHPVNHQPNAGLEYELWRYENIEVMQFTGLTDKNGKEIYEGDVLKNPVMPQWFNWLVSYHDGGFVTQNIGVDGYLMDKFPLNKNCTMDREVIGNIYENPELLKP